MTENSRLILQFLAEGCTLEEVFWHYPSLDYQDVGLAAKEALNGILNPNSGQRIDRIKSRYPKAYARWSEEEQEILAREFQAGNSVRELAELLNRQPGAVRIRLEKLGFIEPDESRGRRFPL